MVIEVGRKPREWGRRQPITNNHSHKIRRPSKITVPCEGLEPRDGRRGTGLGRVEEIRRSTRNLRKIWDVIDVGNEGDSGGTRNKQGQKSISSLDAGPEDLENRKEAGK